MIRKLLHIILAVSVVGSLHSQGLQTFDDLLQFQFTREDSLQIKILEATQAYILKDKGLRFNSSAGTNEFGDLETGNIFRVKAGLEWNILNEGFMDRKLSAEILEIEKKIKEQELQIEAVEDNYAYIYNHIIYSFNLEKLRFIEEKSFLLDILTKRYEALYYNHAAEYQDLIAIADKVDELRILHLSLTNYNQHFERTVSLLAPPLLPNYLPVLDLKIEEITAYHVVDTTFETIQNLKLLKNDLQHRQSRQKRLAVYNNLYWRPLQQLGQRRTIYNGFGVRFATDLVNRKDEQAKIVALENQLDIQKHDDKIFNEQKELSNHLLEYYAKLRLYSRFKYKLKRLEENKRLDQVVKVVNYRDPQSDLKGLNIDLEKLSVEYELLEIKQQLYLLLLKIYDNAEITSILPYVEEREFEQLDRKLTGERMVSIDNVGDIDFEKEILVEYLKKNEINTLVIREDILYNKDLISLLGSRGIDVYSGYEAIAHRNIVEVPVEQFSTRVEMEYWISDSYKTNTNTLFEIKNINKLIQLDSAVLEK